MDLVPVAIVMLAGLVGVVVPVVPGLLITLAAGLWWVYGDGPDATHWVVFAVMAVIFVIGTALKYVVAARTTSKGGASTLSLLFAAVLGIVGFFVVPIAGGPLGFVLGVYLGERVRLGEHARAWTSTKAALHGVLRSMLIEFSAGVLMIAAWLVGVALT